MRGAVATNPHEQNGYISYRHNAQKVQLYNTPHEMQASSYTFYVPFYSLPHFIFSINSIKLSHCLLLNRYNWVEEV